MNRKFIIILTCIFSATLLASEVPKFAKICMDCHGKNGVSNHSDVPIIAGASSVFIEETLFAYKDKIRPVVKSKYRAGDISRPETDMKQIADKLSYMQIIDVAEYFSSKPFIPAKQAFDAKLVPLGKKVHKNKCATCHGEEGRDVVSNAGILAGQWTPYLKSTMEYLRDGRRDTDIKMKEMIATLNKKEWDALLAYYASQQDQKD